MTSNAHNEALLHGIRAGDTAALEAALAAGADPNATAEWETEHGVLLGTAALSLAAEHDSLEMVCVLIAAGADLQRSHAVLKAVELNDVRALRLLLDRGADVTAYNSGWPLLTEAVRLRCHERILRLLIEAGADVNAEDWEGTTPLFNAAGWDGSVEVVRILVAAGADVNHRNTLGETPLMWAAYQRDRFEMIDALIAAGADPNVVNEKAAEKGVDTFTALITAIIHSRGQNFSALLRGGADVNLPDSDGWTPLMWAANGDELTLKVLIEHGADVHAESRDGRTAKQMVEEHFARALTLFP